MLLDCTSLWNLLRSSWKYCSANHTAFISHSHCYADIDTCFSTLGKSFCYNFLLYRDNSLRWSAFLILFFPALCLSVIRVSNAAVAFIPLSIFLGSSSFLYSGNIKDRVTPVIVAWWGCPLDRACHPMPNDDRKAWHYPQLPWRDFPTDNATLTSPASKGSSKAAKPSCQTDFTTQQCLSMFRHIGMCAVAARRWYGNSCFSENGPCMRWVKTEKGFTA